MFFKVKKVQKGPIWARQKLTKIQPLKNNRKTCATQIRITILCGSRPISIQVSTLFLISLCILLYDSNNYDSLCVLCIILFLFNF